MSDYAITMRVRNGRIHRRIAELGFDSVLSFCKAFDLSPTAVGNVLNLKQPPLLSGGSDGRGQTSWRKVVLDLADALGCTPDDLFSEEQRTMALTRNSVTRLFTEGERLQLMAALERPLLESGEDQMVEAAQLPKVREIVAEALAELTPRERRVLEMRFGMAGEEESTLEEVARNLDDGALSSGVTKERIRQIEAKALRKLRHPSRSEPLRELLAPEDDCIQDDRVRVARDLLEMRRKKFLRMGYTDEAAAAYSGTARDDRLAEEEKAARRRQAVEEHSAVAPKEEPRAAVEIQPPVPNDPAAAAVQAWLDGPETYVRVGEVTREDGTKRVLSLPASMLERR